MRHILKNIEVNRGIQCGDFTEKNSKPSLNEKEVKAAGVQEVLPIA